jgi:DNA-binding LacI/PurR family transcriptional regulator
VAIGMMNGIARAGLVPGATYLRHRLRRPGRGAIATPALTTVWNGQSEVGRNAARALLDKLSGSHAFDHLHLIKPEMRIRQSTAPRKA